jgi:hypothetical protein
MNNKNNNQPHKNKRYKGNPTKRADIIQKCKNNNSQSRLALISKKLNLYLLVQFK